MKFRIVTALAVVLFASAMVSMGCTRGGGEKAPAELSDYGYEIPSWWAEEGEGSESPETPEVPETPEPPESTPSTPPVVVPLTAADVAAKVDKVLAFLMNGDIRQVDETKPYPRKLQEIMVIFTEDLDAEAKDLAEDEFKLLREGAEVTGTLSWYDDKTLEFKLEPDDLSPYGARHRVRIDTETIAAYRTMVLNDMNGNGKADIILGAPAIPAPASSEAYIIWGKSGLSDNKARDIANVIISEENADSWMGYAAAIVGDLNADGYADAAIGAPHFDSTKGKVYILFGGASMPASIAAADAPTTIMGTVNDLQLGIKIAAVGDVNGDGYDDLLLSSPNALGKQGEAYLFSGKELYSTSSTPLELTSGMAHLDIVGEPALYQLGESIAAADLNGDGLQDILVGAPLVEIGGTKIGRLYVILGKPTLGGVIKLDYINTPYKKADMRIDGPAVTQPPRFAFSASGIGDVDGDGSEDIIVGAPTEVVSTMNKAGAVYFLSGRRIVDDVELQVQDGDRVLSGDAAGYSLGFAVACIGRYDDDGHLDYMVGAPGYNSTYGVIELKRGNIAGFPKLEWTSFSHAYFGKGISGLGDIDEDGLADFMVNVSAQPPQGTSVVIFRGRADGVLDFTNSFILQTDHPDRKLGIGIGGQLSH